MDYTLLAIVPAVLSLLGLVVSGLQVTRFHNEVRQTLSIERKAMLRTMLWVVAGGCWTGFLGGVAAILVLAWDQQVNVTGLGAAALLLGVPVVVVLILLVSFLVGVFQLYALTQSTVLRGEKEKRD